MSELVRCQRDHWHDLKAGRPAQPGQREELTEIRAVSGSFTKSDWRTGHQVRFDGKAATAGTAQNGSLSACDLSRRVCVGPSLFIEAGDLARYRPSNLQVTGLRRLMIGSDRQATIHP